MTSWSQDPVVVELRERISEADLALLQTLNRRIELVERLRTYKEERGYPFVDREREEALLARLAEANTGPLTPEGLREFFASLLDLVKREVASDGRP
jgi:chorismate mutase/prephenate dehydratase